eukprot:scaffold12203_cov99-Isochrysis_galbana.AAC.3
MRTRAEPSTILPEPGRVLTTLPRVGAAGLPRGPTIWVNPDIPYIGASRRGRSVSRCPLDARLSTLGEQTRGRRSTHVSLVARTDFRKD